MDLLLVRTAGLEAEPGLGRALMGAWYETMALLASDGPKGRDARDAMARAAGTDRAGYEAQLASTRLFLTPDDALTFVTAPRLRRITAAMMRFLSDEGLLGRGAVGAGAGALGVAFPDGTVTGDPDRVVLRYDARFVREAAEGGF